MEKFHYEPCEKHSHKVNAIARKRRVQILCLVNPSVSRNAVPRAREWLKLGEVTVQCQDQSFECLRRFA